MQRIWYPQKMMIDPFVAQQLWATSGCKVGCMTYHVCMGLEGFAYMFVHTLMCAYMHLWNLCLAFEYLPQAATDGGWKRHSKKTKSTQMYIYTMYYFLFQFSQLSILYSSFHLRLITIVKGYNKAFNILWLVYLM